MQQHRRRNRNHHRSGQSHLRLAAALAIGTVLMVGPVVAAWWANQAIERRQDAAADAATAVNAEIDPALIDQTWVAQRDAERVRRRLITIEAGSAVELAWQQALRFFARTQAPGGFWDPVGYVAVCDGDAQAQPGEARPKRASEIAITSLVILAHTAQGFHHRQGPHATVLAKAAQWLGTQITRDGSVHPRNYAQAIAARALVELWALSGDTAIGQQAQSLVACLQSRAVVVDGQVLGWSYSNPAPGRIDMSVTAWAMPAVALAARHGLVPATAEPAVAETLELGWRLAGALQDPPAEAFAYTINVADQNARRGDRWYLGLGIASAKPMRGGPWKTGLVTVARRSAADLARDPYAAAHALHGLAVVDAPAFAEVYPSVVEAWVASQADGGCLAGSWAPTGFRYHGDDGGRLLSTALVCFALAAVAH